MKRYTGYVLLEDFTRWLCRHHGDKPVGSWVHESVQDFLLEAKNGEGRDRRCDFISRLMVCGFAHLLTPPGRVAGPGHIARGFIPVFVRAFSIIAEEKLEQDLHRECRNLLQLTEDARVPDEGVWTYLLENSATRATFVALISSILRKTCMTRPMMDEVYRTVEEATPSGIEGLYDRDDVYLIFAAWFEFAKRAIDAGENRASLSVHECEKALYEIAPSVISDYHEVAELYLDDIEALAHQLAGRE